MGFLLRLTFSVVLKFGRAPLGNPVLFILASRPSFDSLEDVIGKSKDYRITPSFLWSVRLQSRTCIRDYHWCVIMIRHGYV